jgi:hypothetical protein
MHSKQQKRPASLLCGKQTKRLQLSARNGVYLKQKRYLYYTNPLVTCCILLCLSLLPACKKSKDGKAQGPVLGTCQPMAPKGGLSYSSATGIYTYKSKGGGNISINPSTQITISHDSYPGFKIDFWGTVIVNGVPKLVGNHENLNSKHIKDWWGARRSIIFPDGTKVTFVQSTTVAPIVSVSIYEGSESHHINIGCGKIEYSAADIAVTRQLDDAQADGETGTFEFTGTGLLFVNLYTEDEPGNKKVDRYSLGEIFRAEPSRVTDYYDDPRLNAT